MITLDELMMMVAKIFFFFYYFSIKSWGIECTQFQNMMALLSTTFRHSSRNEKCTKLTNHHRVGTGHELSDTKENILLKTNNIFGVAVAAERSRVYREKRWQMKNTTPDCHIFSFAMYLTYIFCTPEQMKLMTE